MYNFRPHIHAVSMFGAYFETTIHHLPNHTDIFALVNRTHCERLHCVRVGGSCAEDIVVLINWFTRRLRFLYAISYCIDIALVVAKLGAELAICHFATALVQAPHLLRPSSICESVSHALPASCKGFSATSS